MGGFIKAREVRRFESRRDGERGASGKLTRNLSLSGTTDGPHVGAGVSGVGLTVDRVHSAY